MKLDPTALRYLTREELRVLTAVEMGQKNHELVPRELVSEIADLRHGGADKFLRTLLRHKLLHHETKGFDGYRLTPMGYDYLALRALTARGVIVGFGSQIGVGKESDVYLVQAPAAAALAAPAAAAEAGTMGATATAATATAATATSAPTALEPPEEDDKDQLVLKIHRLGRTSFRRIKMKRDYHGKRGSPSWLYLSRIAAQREFQYMRALHDAGFPTPRPVDANRHTVVMTLLEGKPLHSITGLSPTTASTCAAAALGLLLKLASRGLIHGDFNEFNLAVDVAKPDRIIVYDFPQMVSLDHPNAQEYFERDVEGVVRFFALRFGVVFAEDDDDDVKGEVASPLSGIPVPTFEDARRALGAAMEAGLERLDTAIRASGFGSGAALSREMEEEFEREVRLARGAGRAEDEDDDDDDDDDDAGEEDGEVEGEGEGEDAEHGDDDKRPAAPAGTTAAATSTTRPTSEAGGEQDATFLRRAHKDIKARIKRESKGGKTSRNVVKTKERRKAKGSAVMD